MSTLQVSAVATKPQNSKSGGVILRQTAEYHPSIWGDHFLSYATNSTEMDGQTRQQVEQLEGKVRKMLVDTCNSPSQSLYLIDTVQRLGVSYHFEAEIEEALEQIHKKNDDHDRSYDLYTIALRFRLLRQQGYRVPCDVFDKFKDGKGQFKESLASDVRGMLGLYEATHLRVHGENVLDEALAFTATKLQFSLSSQLSSPLAAQVRHALRQPLHKGIPRLEARHYIDVYGQEPSHNEMLLTFAKLDFNVVQKLHQKEVGELTRWWRNLDIKKKLPFARDRVVECCLWILGVYFEPCYAMGRRIVTKVIALLSIIDDLYDNNCATIEELVLFTEAIHRMHILRWDNSDLDQLPEYMQHVYTTVLDVYREIEDDMAREGKEYLVKYAVQSLKRLLEAYLQEAKWFDEQYMPTVEEYMSVAIPSTCYATLITTSFLGMVDHATKEALEWTLTDPKMIKASSIVCRLSDDIVSNKFEQKRGHAPSAIQCYVKQHGATEEEAIEEFRKQVSDGWKDMNEECLKPTCVAMPLLTRVLNFTRVIDVFYKDGDGYTNAEIYLKDFVASMFVDSVPE